MSSIAKRRILTALALPLTATAAVAIAATPAAAAEIRASVYTTDDNPGGMGNWNGDKSSSSSTEVWNACDHQSDGLRAVTTLSYNGSSWEVHDADGANGVCKLRDDINIPEGATVSIKICLQDGANGTPRFCRSTSGKA
ncbi:hypothetical protein [Streptomyces poonensis]|uniref:Secreted protein n=1 Tax=Streptomyces poonensis TaxID=68255 RepID=A0A918UCR0_9ACTN|nr:hypothetical protein [Streptomyces poonensis]GGY93114.1 hypothetical protein GCM10010365_09650 [Streptomyces poonensis]GLJ87595.1 hypothetical protein GCM10017589_01950 [Streptomyces poonensis]